MEWLLVLLTLSGWSSSSFSEGRHSSQASCSETGAKIVLDLNLLEQKREVESTKLFPGGGGVIAYRAKQWEFICSQVPKK